MELIALISAGAIAVAAALAGIVGTLRAVQRDGYRARPFQSSYDTRRPS